MLRRRVCELMCIPLLHELVMLSFHSLHSETWQSTAADAAAAVGCAVPPESCMQADRGSNAANRIRFIIWHSDLSKLLLGSSSARYVAAADSAGSSARMTGAV